MVKLGVDELTVVLQLPLHIKNQVNPFEWESYANGMIDAFVKKSKFDEILGNEHPEERAPAGYTVAFTYGEHNFYLAVAYHEVQLNMGIVIKFSAQSLDYYLEQSNIEVYEFLQMIQSKQYTLRVSRMDLIVDYINEDIDITSIYHNLTNKKIAVFREIANEKTKKVSYRRCNLDYQGYIKGQEVPTIYIGSAKSNLRLRIYDKKREQIETYGTKMDKAVEYKNWTRFEGVFRHEYAHQLGDKFLLLRDDNEYANLIACIMLQKYKFMNIKEGVIIDDTHYTKLLSDCIDSKKFILKAPSSKNYDIARSVKYLLSGSGIVSTLYKIEKIWGKDATKQLLKYIQEYVEKYIENDDCRYWLKKNKDDYKRNYPHFDLFINENLMIEKKKKGGTQL